MNDELQLAMWEKLPTPVSVKDDQLRLIWVNPAFARFFGVAITEGRFDKADAPISASLITSELKVLGSGVSNEASHTATDSDGNEREILTETHLLELEHDTYLVGYGRDVTEISGANAVANEQALELETLRSIDPLTRCLNRAAFFEQCNEQPTSPKGHGVILLAADDLKAINNVYGHDAADEALVQTIAVVRDQLADDDLVCRFGGGEFVIAAQNRNSTATVALADSIQRAVEKTTVTTTNGHFDISVSVGVSHARSIKRDDLDRALATADGKLFLIQQQRQSRVLAS